MACCASSSLSLCSFNAVSSVMSKTSIASINQSGGGFLPYTHCLALTSTSLPPASSISSFLPSQSSLFLSSGWGTRADITMAPAASTSMLSVSSTSWTNTSMALSSFMICWLSWFKRRVAKAKQQASLALASRRSSSCSPPIPLPMATSSSALIAPWSPILVLFTKLLWPMLAHASAAALSTLGSSLSSRVVTASLIAPLAPTWV
mmetsp:Transcript_9896/g.20133  ORF Transcript_9896/g.20133 Transcript_9896/m.20133 type:complete len:205 (-) Transcript_9896:1315-1929(-)